MVGKTSYSEVYETEDEAEWCQMHLKKKTRKKNNHFTFAPTKSNLDEYKYYTKHERLHHQHLFWI